MQEDKKYLFSNIFTWKLNICGTFEIWNVILDFNIVQKRHQQLTILWEWNSQGAFFLYQLFYSVFESIENEVLKIHMTWLEAWISIYVAR